MSEYSDKQLDAGKLLAANWAAFCDRDPLTPAELSHDDFIETMETAGFVSLREVTKKDVEDDVFAVERGIEMGGHIWKLTEMGVDIYNRVTDEQVTEIIRSKLHFGAPNGSYDAVSTVHLIQMRYIDGTNDSRTLDLCAVPSGGEELCKRLENFCNTRAADIRAARQASNVAWANANPYPESDSIHDVQMLQDEWMTACIEQDRRFFESQNLSALEISIITETTEEGEIDFEVKSIPFGPADALLPLVDNTFSSAGTVIGQGTKEMAGRLEGARLCMTAYVKYIASSRVFQIMMNDGRTCIAMGISSADKTGKNGEPVADVVLMTQAEKDDAINKLDAAGFHQIPIPSAPGYVFDACLAGARDLNPGANIIVRAFGERFMDFPKVAP